MFRAVGLSSQIPQVPLGKGRPRRVAVESLAGKWFAEADWSASKPQAAKSDGPLPTEIGYSLVTCAAITQDRLEPIIRDKAIELGADVRLNTELTSFEQDAIVDLDGLRSVFAEDATWESADMQISGAGIDQIGQGVEDMTAGVEFSMHSLTNPIIAVHADQATGAWLLWSASKIGGQAKEVFLGEDVTYVRTPRGWRMKSVNLHVGMALIP